MKPIGEFPYMDVMSKSNPMHGRLLLLEMNGQMFTYFNFGYYDAINDVFWVCSGDFMNTSEHTNESRPLDGAYIGMSCMMPQRFTRAVGPKRIRSFMEMNEMLDTVPTFEWMAEADLMDMLKKSGYTQKYLICTKDDCLMIADVGNFVNVGKAFAASSPCKINGQVYHANGPVPLDSIKWAVNLSQWKDNLGEWS